MKKSVMESLKTEYDVSMFKKKPFLDFMKRCFDITVSFLFLVLFFWFYLILALIVKCTSKGPAFYAHTRVGRNGKVFKVWKFRSMYNDQRPMEEVLSLEQLEEYNHEYKVTDDPRVTKFGKFLRKTSLDELPQMVNILKGEMSFVGWRPILPVELENYGKNKELLLKVKPGLTGFWAANGRSKITYADRVKMELYYVVKRSIWLDIRIIFSTFFNVLAEKGAE